MIQIRQLIAFDLRQFQELCALLIDAVEGGASVGFLTSLSMQTAAEYWQAVAGALSPDFPSGSTLSLALFIAEEDGGIVGSVQVALCTKGNGRHRAEVQKLFVLRSCRGKRIATQLMHAAEEYAVSQGRTLLVLDTETGSLAESVYIHLGWSRGGVIPDYAASPDGSLHATTYLYKRIGSLAGESVAG